LFITADSENWKQEIDKLPEVYWYYFEDLPSVIQPLIEKGLRSVILFGVIKPEEKDSKGSKAVDWEGPVIQAIKILKSNFPDLFVICDVCLCPYTDHGHCGYICSETGEIKNEKSVKAIGEIAL